MTTSSASLSTAVAGPVVTPPSDTAAVPVLPPIAVRLNGSNFMLWKALALPNLAGARLHGFLDGSAPAPSRTIREGTGDAARDVDNPAYAQWWTLDQRVLGHLLGSMHEEVSAQLIGCATAEAAWSAVHAMFSAENRAGIRALRREIQGLKKGDKSASEYMQKVKALADAMAAAGSPLRDDEIIDYMLTGLGTAYNPIAASMDFATTPVTMAMFYKTVLNYEGLQKQQQADPEDWTSSANAASRPYFNNSGRAGDSSRPSGGRPAGGGSQGQHGPVQGGNGQGSGGHGGGGQDRRRNDGNGGNNGRNGGGRRRWRPQCQICDIWGHDASDCRRRYDPKQRTGNSASTSSNEQYWHLDSGASDHLTSDLERLHVHDRYHGKDQVQETDVPGAVLDVPVSVIDVHAEARDPMPHAAPTSTGPTAPVAPCDGPPCPSPPAAPSPPGAAPDIDQPASPPVEGSPALSTAMPAAAPGHAMITHARDNTRREKTYTDGHGSWFLDRPALTLSDASGFSRPNIGLMVLLINIRPDLSLGALLNGMASTMVIHSVQSSSQPQCEWFSPLQCLADGVSVRLMSAMLSFMVFCPRMCICTNHPVLRMSDIPLMCASYSELSMA
ncbi:hypothetical protein QYE76_064818 [Lolium multiflorum]|uniref:Retrotransposon Copia-like N-terminal domain-containing protein n=1 Tax=Lolium multiflorum TaxID=4521 RepID=A0AAD8W8A0_LOLMU|nr:hypothetical protein QYE76_064818 [Lolium multiflorum]